MANNNNNNNNNKSEQALQALWSTSFDGWINVPHHPPGVVYLRPASKEEDVSSAVLLSSSSIKLPSVVKECQGGIYALTAFNPFGQTVPMATNVAANQRLWSELQELEGLKYVWKSFGFAKDWREDGFVVAFDDNTTTARDAAKAVHALALKYQQGAIYEFVPIISSIEDGVVAGFRRKTIPVAMENVEADVIVVPCSKPDIANAEVDV